MSGWTDKEGKVKLQAPHLFAKWYVSALLARCSETQENRVVRLASS
jgi:hypothetical protein